MNKAEIRRELKAARAAVTDRPRRNEAISARLLKVLLEKDARRVLLYHAVGAEVDVRSAFMPLQARGCLLCLPRVVGRELLAVPFAESTVLRKGAFGIPEPEGEGIDPASLDAVVCPGLGFDVNGGRIGYGGGFYDRFLKKTAALRVGLCYNACMREHLPMGPMDERMDIVVTESETLKISRGRCV